MNCGSFDADTVYIPCEHNSKLTMYKIVHLGGQNRVREKNRNVQDAAAERNDVWDENIILTGKYFMKDNIVHC